MEVLTAVKKSECHEGVLVATGQLTMMFLFGLNSSFLLALQWIYKKVRHSHQDNHHHQLTSTQANQTSHPTTQLNST